MGLCCVVATAIVHVVDAIVAVVVVAAIVVLQGALTECI
jgi:hypothetical protein